MRDTGAKVSKDNFMVFFVSGATLPCSTELWLADCVRTRHPPPDTAVCVTPWAQKKRRSSPGQPPVGTRQQRDPLSERERFDGQPMQSGPAVCYQQLAGYEVRPYLLQKWARKGAAMSTRHYRSEDAICAAPSGAAHPALAYGGGNERARARSSRNAIFARRAKRAQPSSKTPCGGRRVPRQVSVAAGSVPTDESANSPSRAT